MPTAEEVVFLQRKIIRRQYEMLLKAQEVMKHNVATPEQLVILDSNPTLLRQKIAETNHELHDMVFDIGMLLSNLMIFSKNIPELNDLLIQLKVAYVEKGINPVVSGGEEPPNKV